jgi:Cation transporter/ATPase, N-terminus
MSNIGAPGGPAFWQSSLESLLAELHADGSGLEEGDAARRIAFYGPNVLRPRRERAIVLQFLSRSGRRGRGHAGKTFRGPARQVL